jgi:hypothetical protein
MSKEGFGTVNSIKKIKQLMKRERSALIDGEIGKLSKILSEMNVVLSDLNEGFSPTSQVDLMQLSDDILLNQKILQSARFGLSSAYESIKIICDPNVHLKTYSADGQVSSDPKVRQEKKF